MTTVKFFQAEWCGPCKQQKPIVSDIEADRDDVTIKRVDIEDSPDEANKYQVRSVPSLVVLNDDDGVVKQFSGVTQREDIEDAIDRASTTPPI